MAQPIRGCSILELFMTKRLPIKTSTRFKIFERDNFCCQYCGKKPPQIILHIDHIHPVKHGGGNEDLNLITSCQDCNFGKRDKILKNPLKTDVKQEIENLEEVEQQVKMYYKYLKKIKNIKEKDPIIELLCETWQEQSNHTNSFTDIGKKNLKGLLRNNLAEDIIEAMKIAWTNTRIEEDQKFKYMCGVLKNLKLKRDNPEQAKLNDASRQAYYGLLQHWKNQRRGSGYLPDYKIKEWLVRYTEDEIKAQMDIANGMWSDLKDYFDIKK